MPDYRSNESIPEKERLVEEVYGDQVPGYLLFHLGGNTRLTDAEEQMLNDTFFEGEHPGFGGKELHRSDRFSGSYLRRPGEELQPFVVLRIRDAKQMAYSIEIGGETCHLIQVTNGDNSKPAINFLEKWGPSPKDLRKETSGDSNPISTPQDPWGRPTAFVENTVVLTVTPTDEDLPPEPRPTVQTESTEMPPPQQGPIGRLLNWIFG